MGQDAECYQKTVDDRIVILNVRGYYIQPFIVGDWTDLRLGFFVSLTDDLADDTVTGLAETIPTTNVSQPQNRYWIGLKSSDTGIPAGSATTFVGFSNAGDNSGDSLLLSSDSALGTTNANYWRPANSRNNNLSAIILDGSTLRASGSAGLQQHFPQDPVGAGGYAVMLAIQLLRPNPNSRTVRVRIKSSPNSADMLYSNAPTKELIHQTMETWPPSVLMGPVTLSQVPNAFYFYWPFRNSRLRVHSLGLLRAA
jgi:hypothetical protein